MSLSKDFPQIEAKDRKYKRHATLSGTYIGSVSWTSEDERDVGGCADLGFDKCGWIAGEHYICMNCLVSSSAIHIEFGPHTDPKDAKVAVARPLEHAELMLRTILEYYMDQE